MTRVLVIDDDVQLTRALTSALLREGFEPVVAGDATSGVEQLAIAEEEGAGPRWGRRPGIELSPPIASGLEDVGLREVGVGGIGQVMLEESSLDLRLVEGRCVRAEVDVAQASAGRTSPASVRPGSHHEHVG